MNMNWRKFLLLSLAGIDFGADDAFISLTLIACGTFLPELTASVAAVQVLYVFGKNCRIDRIVI